MRQEFFFRVRFLNVISKLRSTAEGIDEVGITERLDPLVERLARRFGPTLGVPRHRNASPEPGPVPSALIGRICADSVVDMALYEVVRRRAMNSD